jgi:hypothetical protein
VLAAKNSTTQAAKITSLLSRKRDCTPCHVRALSCPSPTIGGWFPAVPSTRPRPTRKAIPVPAQQVWPQTSIPRARTSRRCPSIRRPARLPMEAKRALQPIRSLRAASPTNVKLIAAMPGPITELVKPELPARYRPRVSPQSCTRTTRRSPTRLCQAAPLDACRKYCREQQLAEQTVHRSNGQCEADRLRWHWFFTNKR